MKTKHIHTHIDKDNHCIRVWLDPSVDIYKFEKSIHAIKDLLNALNDAKGQLFYLRTKLTPRQYKFTTPTSEAVNQVIDQAIKQTE